MLFITQQQPGVGTRAPLTLPGSCWTPRHALRCSQLATGSVQRNPPFQQHHQNQHHRHTHRLNATPPQHHLPPTTIPEDLLTTPLPELMARAKAIRDATHGAIITFSPKVFIPLTRLCRDSCAYCTFAQPPKPSKPAYMTIEEVVEVAKAGALLGATEALFTLGDKPELLYPEASQQLEALGYNSTLEYVEAAAAAVLVQTGLLPHINAGVMDLGWLQRLRQVSASQGLMLESTSTRLMGVGGAHYNCPDKVLGFRCFGYTERVTRGGGGGDAHR